MNGEEIKSLSFADFTLEPQRRRLLRDGTNIPLNAKAFDLLVFFARNAGRVVTKDEILDSVWKDQFVEESNLTVQVSAIRRALGDQASESRFLVTVPGKGYQFVADVMTDSETDHSSTDDAPQHGAEIDASPVPVREVARNRFGVNPQIAAIVVATVLVAGFVTYRYFKSDTTPTKRSIAVLPFEDQTGDVSLAYLGDGLAESVIFSLSRVPDLRVMSRDSTFAFRNDNADARRLGKELNVQTVLRSRFSRRGSARRR
jgi:DNA-binding winged helix-turn-helix (wHTH) protein